MSERSGTETRRRRTKQVAVRLTPIEYEALSNRARAIGISVPALLRRDSLRRRATR